MNHSNKTGAATAVTGLALLLAACAATPPAPTPPQTSAQTAAMAVAAQSGRPEFPGFVLTVRKGEELYCQKRNPTGSRARVVEACYTRDQMLKMAANADDFFKQAGANGSHDSLRTDSPR
jgi:hypothetical protein